MTNIYFVEKNPERAPKAWESAQHQRREILQSASATAQLSTGACRFPQTAPSLERRVKKCEIRRNPKSLRHSFTDNLVTAVS